MNSLFRLTLILALSLPTLSFAKEFPVQARLFLGSTGVSPDNVNQIIELQGLKEIDRVNKYGLEITYPVMSYLDVGIRYTKIFGNFDEKTSDPSTPYEAKLDQDTVLLVARVPLLKNDFLRVDAFGGFGGSNTSLKIKTGGQDGELSKKASTGWFASPYSAVGASLSVGFKWVYVVFEGGVDTNKVDSFSRSGSVSSSINTLDLSGSYFTLGLMFDKIPGFTK